MSSNIPSISPNFVTSCLRRLTSLRVYKAIHGEAPHKPLLLLVLIELAEQGALPADRLWLTPELSYRFDTYWDVVAYRRPQKSDIRLPFHHLSGDGLLSPFTESGVPSTDTKLTRYVCIDPEFLAAASDAGFREQARRYLIARYFQPAERNALYNLVGMPIPSEDQDVADASFVVPDDAAAIGRQARFRLNIVAAYNYTCALTRYRVTTIGSGAIVDAAHIHEFAASRNNDPANGLALCKNAHWLFDVGLWSIDNEYRILVAKGEFDESAPEQTPLIAMHGKTLYLPANLQLWPDPVHMAWHRKNRFVGRV